MTERFITYRSALLWALAAALPGAALGLFYAGLGFDPLEVGRHPLGRLWRDFGSAFLLVLPSTPLVLFCGFLHARFFNWFYSDPRREAGAEFVGVSLVSAGGAGAAVALALDAGLFAGSLTKTLAAAGFFGGAFYGLAVAVAALRRASA